MTIAQIDKEFCKLIQIRAPHNMILPLTASKVERRRMSSRIRRYRNILKNGGKISIDTKLSIIQRSKISVDALQYSREDMLRFAAHVLKQSAFAKGDIAYMLEKWELIQKK